MERSRHQLPPRPLLPPSCAGATMAWAVAAFMLQLSWRQALADEGIALYALCAVAAGIFVIGCSFALSDESTRRWLVWAGVGIALSAALSWHYAGMLRAQRSDVVDLPASSYRFVVIGDPSQIDSGYIEHADVYLDRRRIASIAFSASQCIERGKRFAAIGRWGAFSDNDWVKSNYLQGYVATLQVIKILHIEDAPKGPIETFRSEALHAIAPESNPSNALMAALLCGRTTELKSLGVKDAFARTGLSHLTAVSGTHLAMVGAVIAVAFDRKDWYGVSRSLCTALILLAYTVFTGLSVSAIRAFVMVFLTLVVNHMDRRRHALSSLMITVFAMILLDPGVVLELGFQLSALSVLFILLFCSYVEMYLRRAHLPEVCARALSCSLVAQAATLPLTIPVFGYVSLVAPLANLIAGPLVSVFLPVGLASLPCMVIAPWLQLCAAIPHFFASSLWFIAQLLSGIPCAAIPLQVDALWCCGFYLIPIGIYVLWPDIRARSFALLSVILCLLFAGHHVRWNRFAPPSVTVLDVGQADCILIRDGSTAVLVDAGVDERALAALVRNNVYHLDAVLITHWDEDHWGGLPDILSYLSVDTFFIAQGASSSVPSEISAQLAGKMKELELNQVLHIGGFDATCVWPKEEVSGEDNADSLCLKAEYRDDGKELTVLLTGDSESDEQLQYAERVGDIDVLKVGHHGSKVSVDDEVLRTIKPELCVASAGENNRYGHPSQACQEAISAYGSRFVCTIDAGDVVIEPDKKGIKVATQHAVE